MNSTTSGWGRSGLNIVSDLYITRKTSIGPLLKLSIPLSPSDIPEHVVLLKLELVPWFLPKHSAWKFIWLDIDVTTLKAR